MALSRTSAPCSRRAFLRALTGATLAGLSPHRARAERETRSVLVCVNLVGGLDGSSVLVPYGEDAYYRARPHLAVPEPGRPDGALRLSDGFGLHPKLEPLHRLYQAGELAIVPAAGSVHIGRSHFAAREALHRATMTSGGQGARALDGWANRYARTRAPHGGDASLYSTTPDLPRAMVGDAPTEMIGDHEAFQREDDEVYLRALEHLYSGSSDPFAQSASRALRFAEHVRDKARTVRLKERYSKYGRGLGDAARLIVADVGAEIIWVEMTGFDTHKSQGGAQGYLAQRLERLGQDLAAFRHDLGSAFADVTVVTLTEFGRTLAETGAGGTDHGAASCMLVLGGRVRGGRLVGDWPGLDQGSLREGRELRVTTDYRAVLAEVLTSQLGLDANGLAAVFPGLGVPRAPLGLYSSAS